MNARNPFAPAAVALLAGLTAALPPAVEAQGPGFTGLSTVRSQYFENENLLFYVPVTHDYFGGALATGDFNGDGADDLATGVPGDDGLVGFEVADMGIVVVRYGIPGRGLESGLADTVISKQNSGSSVEPGIGNQFGYSLAAGDFDGDGFDDLAVGSPGDSYCSPASCNGGVGAVFVLYGSGSGIETAPGWPLGSLNLFPFYGWGTGNYFGMVLASGNFNGDLYDDLAIASPYYDYDNLAGDHTNAGGAWVVHGGAGGIATDGFFVSLGQAPIPDSPEAYENFGGSLAVGNFNGDTHSIGNHVIGFDDLAIGVPSEDDVGAVLVLYGSVNSLQFASNYYFSQWDLGGTMMQAASHFGYSMVAGDFDGNLADDLAISAPHHDLGPGGSLWDAGLVTVVYGQVGGGFSLGLTEWFSQGTLYGSFLVHAFDYFGGGMAAYRFDPHFDALGEPYGRSAIAFGTPGMEWFGLDQGGFTALRGTAAGLAPTFRLATIGPEYGAVPDTGQPTQAFGNVFAVGDFDGDGYDDLAAGNPGRQVGGLGGAGSVMILYGSMFADGFESGDPFGWSAWAF